MMRISVIVEEFGVFCFHDSLIPRFLFSGGGSLWRLTVSYIQLCRQANVESFVNGGPGPAENLVLDVTGARSRRQEG